MYNFITQPDLKGPLRAKIQELETEIANSPYSLEESKAAQEQISAFFSDPESNREDLMDGGWETIHKRAQLAHKIDEVARYKETLSKDLMLVETRYVVTNTERLESPAGFSPDERVFTQTDVAIYCDRKPTARDVPACNQTLYVHDLEVVR